MSLNKFQKFDILKDFLFSISGFELKMDTSNTAKWAPIYLVIKQHTYK